VEGESPTAALVHRVLEVYDSQDYSRLDEVMHDDVVLSFLGVESSGIPVVAERLEAIYAAIPDHFHRVEHIVVDEPNTCAAVQMVVGGHHTAAPYPTSFGGVPASGKYVEWRPGSFIEARDGKVARWTVYLDQVTLLQVLGVPLDPAALIPAGV
jgi:steroid delta-isomerase-like uncharacterized protein